MRVCLCSCHHTQSGKCPTINCCNNPGKHDEQETKRPLPRRCIRGFPKRPKLSFAILDGCND